VPIRQNLRTWNEEALQLSLNSGCYPEFLRMEGPQFGRGKPKWVDIDREEVLTFLDW